VSYLGLCGKGKEMKTKKSTYVSFTFLFIFVNASPVFAHGLGDGAWVLTAFSLPIAIILSTIITGGYSIWKLENSDKKSSLWAKDIQLILIIFFLALIVTIFIPIGVYQPSGILFAAFAIYRGSWMIRKSLSLKDDREKTEYSYKLLGSGGIILLTTSIFLAIAPLTIPTRYKVELVNLVEPKSNLYNLHLACNKYWSKTMPDNDCTTQIASQPTYEFVQSNNVIIKGGGNKANFAAQAHLKNSSNIFKIDSTGNMTGKVDYGFNWYEKFLNSIGLYDRPS
jgi:hypothetical protein